MSSPISRAAYQDCFDFFDRAVESRNGIRFQVPNESVAINQRMRLHMARKIARDESERLYSPDHPSHGISPYDTHQVLIRSDGEAWWVYIEPRTIPIVGEIQELGPQEATSWLAQSSPQKLISHSGSELLEKKSDSGSNALIEHSSSTPSTPQERTPVIQGLRRL